MANNRTSQQRQTTFQIVEPLFYKEFNEKDPIFDEWTLERMPRNVNLNRVVLDKYKMSNGWLYESYNTKGRFRCIGCIKRGINEHDATWSSAYTTVVFRAYYGPDNDELGQTWLGGWIQMKVFAQQCKKCYEFITPELDNDRSQCLVRWVHQWIATKFYGYPYKRSYYRGKKMTDLNHLPNLCEACATGWCSYRIAR